MRACVLAQMCKVCRCVKCGVIGVILDKWVSMPCVRDVCHGLLTYAYTCVDGWLPGYTCKGIMSAWMRGCVDEWMRGCVAE